MDLKNKSLLERQDFYQKKVTEKQAKLKEKLLENDSDSQECTFKPKINNYLLIKSENRSHSPLIKKEGQIIKEKKKSKSPIDTRPKAKITSSETKPKNTATKKAASTPIKIRGRKKIKENGKSSNNSKTNNSGRFNSKSPSNYSADSKRNDSFNIVTGGISKNTFNLEKILNESNDPVGFQESRNMNISTKDSFNESLKEKERGIARNSRFLNTVQEFGVLEDEILNLIENNDQSGKNIQDSKFSDQNNQEDSMIDPI